MALLCGFAVVSVPALRAQAPSAAPLVFEVASIRLNTSGAQGGGGGPRPGGRYTYTNMSVRSLIALAVGLPTGRVIGGPDWIVTGRYDITAVGKDQPSRDETSQLMLALLRDRFKLVAHRETRDLPVYSLVLARPGGPLGPAMRRSAIDCLDAEARKKAYASAPAGGRMLCGLTETPGTFTGGGIDLSTLVVILGAASGRPVLDRTGLTGGFDVDLKWTPELQDRADAVSIFTAVQEQLGLKLENATAPLDVSVVDRIERPSQN
jgi:uncharacterized protein (TIGR03435 family)